jgi:hypothetical protein
MLKQDVWLSLALVFIFAAGCAAGTSPTLEEEKGTTTGEPAAPATATVEPTDSYPAGEATEPDQVPAYPLEAYPVDESANPAPEEYPYPAAEVTETVQDGMDTDPTKTPEPITPSTPVSEEIIQVPPISLKPDSYPLKSINQAKADLADKLGINLPSTQIRVVAYEEVIWSDSSLGCPEPDKMYTQTVVDGYVIQLQSGEQTYNYHGAKGEDPFLCPKTSGLELDPAQESASEPDLDIHAQRRINLAKAYMSKSLGVEFSTIELLTYDQLTWNDGSLGCPQPDTMYTQALVDGYKIQLQAGGQVYNFHGANGEDPFLCES